MPKQLAFTVVKSTIIAIDVAEIFLIYTVPTGKIAYIRQIEILSSCATYICGAIYVLKTGGTDFTTGALASANVLARWKSETTSPSVVIPYTCTESADSIAVLLRNMILNAGDTIKIIFQARSTAPSAGAGKVSVLISGEEI